MKKSLFATAVMLCCASRAVASLSITSPQQLPVGEVNVPYSFTFQGSGGTLPYSWSYWGPPPSGYTLNAATGVFSGTPPNGAMVSFAVLLTDAGGSTVWEQFFIASIAGPPVLQSNTIPWATLGAHYSVSIPLAGGVPPYQASVSGLPNGISYSFSVATITISGTPTTAGSYSPSVMLRDSLGGTSTTPLPFTVQPTPTFSTPSNLPPAAVGIWYQQNIAISGGNGPQITVQSGSLPPGVTVNSSGLVAGTPTTPGTYQFTLLATDFWGATVSQAFTLVVSGALTVSGPSQFSGSVGQQFSAMLQAVNGTPPFNWSVVAGTSPPGVTLSSSGQFSGAPTASGNFSFTVRVTDSTGATASQAMAIDVAKSALQVGATLPDGTTGQPYSQRLPVSGGFPPYQIVQMGLVVGYFGLEFDSSTLLFTGTPTRSGTFSGSVQVLDSMGNRVTQTVTIVIHSGLIISNNSPLPNAVLGQMYSQTLVVTNGVPFYSWSLTSGALPAGLTLSAISGLLSGIPTAAGTFTFQVQVLDSIPNSAQKTFSITVTGNSFTITTGSLPPAFGPGYSRAFAASGGQPPYSWAIASGSLPAGFALNPSTGILTGSGSPPAIASVTPIVVQVTDATGAIAQKSFTLYFAAPLTLTPQTQPFNPSQDVFQHVSGGFQPYSFLVIQGTLPPGLSLTTTGAFVGQASTPGTYPITVQVTDSLGYHATAQEILLIPAAGPLTLLGGTLPSAYVGQQYLANLHASSGQTPYTFSIVSGGLPAGLSLDAASGSITGTAMTITTSSFSAKVVDSTGATATASYTLQTLDSLGIDTGSPLAPGKVGSPYSLILSAGGGIPPYHFAVSSGALPPGLQLTPSTGAIEGTPATAASYSFTITLSDSAGGSASSSFTMAVTGGLVISPSALLPSGVVGTPYSVQFSAQGLAPYSWRLTGNTPPGIGFNPSTALLSGTPSQSGTFLFTLTATDSAGANAQVGYAITVTSAALTISSGNPLQAAVAAASYSQTLSASGGTAPYNWLVVSGILPPGLTLSGAGALSGEPTKAGAFNFTVRVTDATSATATQVFNLSVNSNCAFAVSPGAQAFPAAGANGTIRVTAATGCEWGASVGPAWVALQTPTSGNGNANIGYTISPNTGGARSGSISVAGKSFVVEQQSASIAALTLTGSMAQLVSGGGWETTFTLLNTGATLAEARVNMYGDSDGPLALPFTFPQVPSPAGPLVASTIDEPLNPKSLLMLDTQQPSTPSSQVGSAQLLSTGDVGGFAILKYTTTGQEAVVPLESGNAYSYVLAFDNTGGLATGVAIANIAPQTANIPVVIRDDQGTQLGADTIQLAAQGHTSFMLTGNYGMAAGKRGTIEFDTPTSGQISVLGLRSNGVAFTTIPALAQTTGGGGSMAQVASGGGWQTTFTLVNTGASSAQAELGFYGDDGNGLSLPLSFPQTGETLTASTLSKTLAAGATLVIVTNGPTAGAPLVGSAQLTASGNLSGFAIFRYNPTQQEAVVPLETRNAGTYVLAFDNTNGLQTGVAMANASGQSASVSIIIRDDNGKSLCTAVMSLAGQGHTSFVLADQYPYVAGARGTVEFDAPPGVQVSVLGLRVAPAGAITTIPVLAK